jgi:hypothetical protein
MRERRADRMPMWAVWIIALLAWTVFRLAWARWAGG